MSSNNDSTSSNSSKKKSTLKKTLGKPFKSKKVGLLKQNVSELESSLRQTEEELLRAKDEISLLGKEIKDLQSTYDNLKVDHATHIDDLMEKMMEEQVARAREREEAEEKLQVLTQEYEDKIMIIETEGDHKAEQLKKDLTEQLESTKELSQKEKDEIIKAREEILAEREKVIAALEKERRSVKKLVTLTRKAMQKNVFGAKPGKQEKIELARKARERIAAREEEKSAQSASAGDANSPAPVFIDSSDAKKEAVVIELTSDFGGLEKTGTGTTDSNLTGDVSEATKASTEAGKEEEEPASPLSAVNEQDEDCSDQSVGQNITECDSKEENNVVEVKDDEEVPKEIEENNTYEVIEEATEDKGEEEKEEPKEAAKEEQEVKEEIEEATEDKVEEEELKEAVKEEKEVKEEKKEATDDKQKPLPS